MDALNKNNDKLSDLQGDFREFKGSHNVRVNVIEENMKSDKFWAKVQTIGTMPVVLAIHQIGKHFGILK